MSEENKGTIELPVGQEKTPGESTPFDNPRDRVLEREAQGNEGNQQEATITTGREFLQKFGIDTSEMSNKEVIEKLDKIRAARARSTEVLSKGPTIDAMEILLKKVPRGFIGEWVLESNVEIPRKEALGWEVLQVGKNSKKETPTGSADGLVRLGDCVLMVIPEEQFIANRLIKLERLEARRRLSIAQTEAKRAEQETSAWTVPVVEL